MIPGVILSENGDLVEALRIYYIIQGCAINQNVIEFTVQCPDHLKCVT